MLASRRLASLDTMTPNAALLMRKPKRVSITVSHIVIERLQRLSDEQGRSTSNLAAHLLEVALDGLDAKAPTPKSWPSRVA
jgi:hypothetical protein